MGKTTYCAVVVTYHPDDKVGANLRQLSLQAKAVVVIDNGSAADEVHTLRSLCAELGLALIENGSNLGIAAALNQGVRWARAQSAAYVFLFDQDSTIEEGFIMTMLTCFEQSQNQDCLAILVPRYIDRRSGMVLYPPKAPGEQLAAATTSGSLTPMRVFDAFGDFAEELFIDGVDYEFSLRVRSGGKIVLECAQATLLHAPGETTSHRLLRWVNFRSANYGPVRRYYQVRNRIWVTRRYWRKFLPFCFWQLGLTPKELIKVLVVEKDRRRKLHYMVRGLLDGLRGRSGPLRA